MRCLALVILIWMKSKLKKIVYPFVCIELVFSQGSGNIIIHGLTVLIQYLVEILYPRTILTILKFILRSTGRSSRNFRFKAIFRTKAWSFNQHTWITHFRKNVKKTIKGKIIFLIKEFKTFVWDDCISTIYTTKTIICKSAYFRDLSLAERTYSYLLIGQTFQLYTNGNTLIRGLRLQPKWMRYLTLVKHVLYENRNSDTKERKIITMQLKCFLKIFKLHI